MSHPMVLSESPANLVFPSSKSSLVMPLRYVNPPLPLDLHLGLLPPLLRITSQSTNWLPSIWRPSASQIAPMTSATVRKRTTLPEGWAVIAHGRRGDMIDNEGRAGDVAGVDNR